MKVIKETVIRKEPVAESVIVKESIATPFLNMLYKYFARYFAKKIKEDKHPDHDYVMEQFAKGGSEEELIQLVGDYVFDLGGLYERLDLYVIDDLNIMFAFIGVGFMIDDVQISKYIYQIMKKSAK